MDSLLPVRSRADAVFVLQSGSYFLYRFFWSSGKAQEVEVYIAHYQVLANGFDDRRPAIAEKDER